MAEEKVFAEALTQLVFPKVSETHFKNVILPAIANANTRDELQPFFDAVGNRPYNALEVWNDNKTHRLFTTPPLFKSREPTTNVNLTALVEYTNIMKRNHRKDADKLLLDTLLPYAKGGTLTETERAGWLALFKFYDIKRTASVVKVPVAIIEEEEESDWN